MPHSKLIITKEVKVALFGASGLLGWSIHHELKRRGFQSYGYLLRENQEKSFKSFTSLDLRNDQQLSRELLDLWPDAIINCAAVSSPDAVNKNAKHAKEINVDAAQRLAQISAHLGARFVHISTDMVFEGRDQTYRSTDSPCPVSEYGRQKLEAEKRVLAATDENIVVLRVTILNGNSPRGNRSPHEKILNCLKNKEPIILFDDEFRQPCSADNVASVVVELLERPNLNGLFHWAGSEITSRYELGIRILERFGFSSEHITKSSLLNEKNRVGQRPSNLTFELSPLVGKIKTKPGNISEQIENLNVPNDLFSWYRENADDPTKYTIRI